MCIGESALSVVIIVPNILGLITSKGLRFLDHIYVAAIALSTFHQHQKYNLHPTVWTLWKEFQNNYFDQKTKQDDALALGGDGRPATLGHSAKNGSYAMLNMYLILVIYIQLVQVWVFIAVYKKS